MESGSGDESGADLPAKSQAPSKGSDSSGSECSRSASPEVVLVSDDEDAAADKEDKGPLDDEEALLQWMVSLLDIFSSDTEEAHKAAACQKVCKSDVQFAAWQDEQIRQGNEAMSWCDK